MEKVSKAIAGAAVTTLMALLVKYGVNLSGEVTDALRVLVEAIVSFVVGFLAVYFSPKNKA